MTNLNELKEVLALHGYKIDEEVNIVEDGLTYVCHKVTGYKDRFLLSFYIDEEMYHEFWTFSLSKSVDFFPKNVYAHPVMHIQIRYIKEEDLRFLPILEKRLSEINSEAIE